MNTVSTRQRGLSIVELMVSVAISVAVLSALSYVYVGSRGAYRTNEALARVQETGRFALEWIARDVRNAGFLGCLSRGTTLEVYTRSGAGAIPFGEAIWGYENGAGFVISGTPRTNPTTIPHLRGDVVVLSMLQTDVIARVIEQGAGNANIKIDNNINLFQPPVAAGDDLVATDCQRASIFNVTTIASGSCGSGNSQFGCVNIAHAGPGQGGIGNSPNQIPSFGRDGSAFVARYARIGYFIGTNARSGRPALYRFTNTSGGAAGNVRTEEVVENVENIDFLFGVDTDSDGVVDRYLTADVITAAVPPQWDRVLSVRVSLTAVGTERFVIASDQRVFLRDTTGDSVVDAEVASPDNTPENRLRLRQVFSTTVALRNRLP